MNSVIASPVAVAEANNGAVAGYEDLRCQAVGVSGFHNGLGMVLFLRQGMTAWMKARLQATSARAGSSCRRGDSDERIPLDLRGEAALILAGMALGGLQGGRR